MFVEFGATDLYFNTRREGNWVVTIDPREKSSYIHSQKRTPCVVMDRKTVSMNTLKRDPCEVQKDSVDPLMCACEGIRSNSPMTPQRSSSLQAQAHHFNQANTYSLPDPGPLPNTRPQAVCSSGSKDHKDHPFSLSSDICLETLGERGEEGKRMDSLVRRPFVSPCFLRGV